MQKSRRWGWLVGLCGLVAFITWLGLGPVFARADYRVDDYHVNVNVQPDGSAQVTQTMAYEFYDDYHGVFNVQDLRGISGAKLETVTTKLNGGPQKVAHAATDGANNTYSLSQNKQRMRIKLYRQVRDADVLRVAYKYQLYGVVTNYADTAELNWKVIGNGWDVALQHGKITIQLPSKNVTTLQAWTHGPLSGHTTVDHKNGRVTLTVQRNPANRFVESHLLFPTSVTATNQRTSSKKRKATVQKQEAALARQANQRRQRSQLLRRVSVVAAGVVWVLIVAGYLWWFYRHPANSHQKPLPLAHSFDVPPVSPAVAQALLTGRAPDTKALTGEILRAAADHEIRIESATDKHRPVVVLTKLKTIHNSFLANCFTTVAPSGTFRLTELKKYGQRDQSGRVNGWFSKWQRTVNQDVAVYRDETNAAIQHYTLGGAIMVTITGIIASGLGTLLSAHVALAMGSVAAIGAVAFWVTWLVRRRQVLTNTDAGLQLINQISGLRRMLKDIGHFNTAEVGDLILWEQLLPYAAAFGLAKKVTAQLAVDFGTDALATGMALYYPLFYANGGAQVDLSGVISNSFSGAISASVDASSSSGASGGFSGGSSGGFGGGSGGGAF